MDSRALTEAIRGARFQPFLFGLFPALSGLVGSTDIFEEIRPSACESTWSKCTPSAAAILVKGGLVLTLARRESLSVVCNKETVKCSSSDWLLHRVSGHIHRFSSHNGKWPKL